MTTVTNGSLIMHFYVVMKTLDSLIKQWRKMWLEFITFECYTQSIWAAEKAVSAFIRLPLFDMIKLEECAWSLSCLGLIYPFMRDIHDMNLALIDG